MEFELSKREIDKALQEYDKAGRQLVNDLMEELLITGFLIETGYKLNVLVDTGRLKSSVHTEYKKIGEEQRGGKEFKLSNNEVKVGTNVHYAPYVEFKYENLALTNAYQKEIAGLMQRLQKIIDATSK